MGNNKSLSSRLVDFVKNIEGVNRMSVEKQARLLFAAGYIDKQKGKITKELIDKAFENADYFITKMNENK